MNLLKDQRELEPQNIEDVFEDSASLDNVFSEPEDEQLEFVPQPKVEPVESGPRPVEEESFDGYGRGFDKKKRSLKIPLGIAAIFIVLVVVLVSFFRPKSGTPPTQDQLANNAEITQQDKSEQSQSEEQTPEQLNRQPVGTVKSAQVIGNIMSTLLSAIPSSSRLSTLFMDDGSFSIEVSGSQADLQKYQSDLKSSLASAKISHGAISGGKTLISGTFPLAENSTSGGSVQKDDVLAQLTSLAGSAGVQVLEKSTKDLRSGGSTKSEIFLKVSGSVDQCQNVLKDFADKNWNVQISKVLLLPMNQQKANLVLRFLV